MKLSTLSTKYFETPDCFNFNRDEQQPEKFYLIGQDTHIIEIKYASSCIDGINFRIEFVKPPKTRPTKKIINNNNMVSIYKKANILNRQTITIDPFFAAEFCQSEYESRAQHICWPKKYKFTKNVITVISNFGQCDLLEFNNVTRTYEKTLVSFNDLIKDLFPSNTVSNFEQLKDLVENNVITTCCWIFTEKNLLVFSTISGSILIAAVNDTFNAILLSKNKTDLYKICWIKSFQYISDEKEQIGIIVSNINGLIKIYHVKDDSLQELCVLWNNEDKMSCKRFHVYFDKESLELTITTAKGCHLLVFIVSTKDWKVVYKANEFLNAHITNFINLSKNQYIACTTIGETKHIKLLKNNEKYTFETSNIKNELEIENYSVYGMASTRNNAGFIFIACPEKSFIINKQRNVSLLSFCTFDDFDPFNVLKNYERNQNDARILTDCYEIIRLQLIKNHSFNNWNLYKFNPPSIDFNFIHKIRTRYNIVSSIMGYNIKKTKTIHENNEIELINIKLTIKAIFAYWRLLKMKDNISTDFQKLSAKCLNRLLKVYLKNKSLKNTEYKHIQELLGEKCNDIISENNYERLIEICDFCGQNTDLENDKCKHDIGRCCISEVQISSLDMKFCESCGEITINNDELLSQIPHIENELRCPVCDYIFNSY